MKQMKKLTLLLLTIVAIAVVSIWFTSCGEDPGVYNPKKKISKIYEQWLIITGEGRETVDMLAEEWKWDRDKLVSISYYYWGGEQEVKEEYIYEGERLIKIQSSSGSYSEYFYNKKKFDKIIFYNPEGVPLLETVYQYDGKKVSSVTFNRYEDNIDKDVIYMLERGFMGKLLSKEGMKIVSKKLANQSKESLVMNFSYKGDNLSSVSMNDESIHFSDYDNHSNIWFNFFKLRLYKSVYEAYGFSKNNPRKIVYKYGSDTDVITYIYTYDGDFPVIIKSNLSHDDEDDDFDYESTSTTRIEYQ